MQFQEIGKLSATLTNKIKEYQRSYIIESFSVTVGTFGTIWLFIEVAGWFGVGIDALKRLGAWGYILFLFISSLIGMVTASVRLFSRLKNEWLKFEISTTSESVDSGDKLSGELVNTVKKLHNAGEHIEVVRLCSVLSRPLWLSGRYEQRLAIGTFFEDSAARLGNKQEQIVALIDDIGWTNAALGNVETAKRNINRGISLSQRNNYHYLEAKGHRHLATIAVRYEKDSKEAHNQFRLAGTIAQRISDENERAEMIATIVYNRSELFLEQKDYQNAEDFARQALERFNGLEDPERAIKATSLIANINLQSGRLDDAREGFLKALNDAKGFARRDEVGRSLLGLGEIYLRENRRELARSILIEAIEVFDEIGSAKELAQARQLYAAASSTDKILP